ncbi:hypothetical protein T440DRAFT_206328 [Plenodomus tracheiphilus IPT5]|uniref:Uncharacterized protein n=1 Tax=Plenodomus tracheiphilus IPT5 TaxID=1408161 RepID=A0A6A7BIL5_9PLEO|nr:hypothetical protein T440DRAFT_206328 [Plenodomus tracheiphilus IPT5]
MYNKTIIAASLVAGSTFVTIMALVTRLLVHKHSKDKANENLYVADGSYERQSQLASISSSWKRLFAPRKDQKGQWVPSLSGIIKAGDDGSFSSALFTNLHGSPGNVPVDALYDAFAAELRSRPMAERSSYSGDITRFISESKRGSSVGVGRTKSVSHKVASGGRRDMTSKSPRKSLDLSAVEMGLVRGMSVKRQSSFVVSMGNGLKEEGEQKMKPGAWMKDGQVATYHDGHRDVKMTASELAALSIVLGSPLNRSTSTVFERGAYGISIQSLPTGEGRRQVTLQQHKRSIAQQHAQGKGPSPLFSKHLAAGSLPYSQDKKAVKSILITTETFDAIRAGASLYPHPTTARTPESRFLTSLPNSLELNFHVLASSTELHSSATLIDAITALPFVGGLVPLASKPVINTIQFIASGGLPAARLLSRLEGLVEKVHRQAPHLKIFGPLYEAQNAGILYRERQRLSKVASDPSTVDTLADKTARMSRYITLLERLMALVPDMKSQDVLAAVREATKIELQRSYADAVATHAGKDTSKELPFVATHWNPPVEAKNKRQSVISRTSVRWSKRASTASADSEHSAASNTSPAPSGEVHSPNLGKQLEQVLKMEVPLSIGAIAYVARMVIVAWTLSVENVAWGYGESGFKVPDIGGLGDKIVLC